MEILLATYNEGKIREIREALAHLPVILRTLAEFPKVVQVAESGETYQDNAILKATGYARQTGLTALADDSGLEVDALGGRPGIYSARFGGCGATDAERIARLLSLLSRQPSHERAAQFVCSMALINAPAIGSSVELGDLVATFEERCGGSISTSARGSNGFGFDPVFLPNGYSLTFGELPNAVKSRLSHRAKALSAIRLFLEEALAQT